MWNARRRASVLRGNTTTSLHWTLIVKYRSFTPSGAQHRFEKLCPSANNAWCWWVTRFKRHINFSSTITTCRSFLANRTRRIRGCRARDSSSQRFEGKKLFVVPLFGAFSYQQDKSDDLRGKTAVFKGVADLNSAGYSAEHCRKLGTQNMAHEHIRLYFCGEWETRRQLRQLVWLGTTRDENYCRFVFLKTGMISDVLLFRWHQLIADRKLSCASLWKAWDGSQTMLHQPHFFVMETGIWASLRGPEKWSTLKAASGFKKLLNCAHFR